MGAGATAHKHDPHAKAIRGRNFAPAASSTAPVEVVEAPKRKGKSLTIATVNKANDKFRNSTLQIQVTKPVVQMEADKVTLVPDGRRRHIRHLASSGLSAEYCIRCEVMPSTNFGTSVHNARRLADSKDVVIKMRSKAKSFSSDPEAQKTWRQTSEYLMNFPKNEHIAEIYEVLEDSEAYYVVMEKVDGLDLFESLGTPERPDRPEVQVILKQLLEAVAVFHEKGYIHRDLKLENVMLDHSPKTTKSRPESGTARSSKPKSAKEFLMENGADFNSGKSAAEVLQDEQRRASEDEDSISRARSPNPSEKSGGSKDKDNGQRHSSTGRRPSSLQIPNTDGQSPNDAKASGSKERCDSERMKPLGRADSCHSEAQTCSTRGDDGPMVKIIDFDTVEDYSPKKTAKHVLGTDMYIAPEAYGGHYSLASDIFAIGVIAYKLLTGKFPFTDRIFANGGDNAVDSPTMRNTQQEIIHASIDWKLSPFETDKDARELCRWMMAMHMDDRPTAVQALAHPWFGKAVEPSPTKKVTGSPPSSSAEGASASPSL